MSFDWLAKDGKVVLVEKVVRTVPYGFLGVLFSVYLSSQFNLDAFLIGVVLALTVASSAIYTLVASVFADRLGRRRTLIFFALTDALAGALLFSSNSLWAPVTAGIVGNMTVGAGEVGPFLTLEQAILPGTSDSKRRTLGFSVYNLVGYVSSSAGALMAGLPQYIGPAIGYRLLFLAYLASGLLGAYLYSKLSKKVEKEKTASPSITVLSEASKPVVRKLSALFSLDSFGGGFIGISIVSYYFYTRYSLQLDSLGLLFAGTQIITAMSFLVAERIARQIGLIKTMVYTHIPSNLLLAIIPLVSSAPIAIGLLFSRQSLSQMDVPTRQSYLMSVVPETDRTPAAGFTNVSRSIAQTFSPSIAGYAIATLWLGSPFVIAGALKVGYDLALYKIFHKLKPPQEAQE